VFIALAAPRQALAHCDGIDGPVVKAARAALAKGDVTPVLVWVRAQDEGEVRAVFDKTRAVRALSPDAKELADRYFFETVVRIHRAGEGAPYTGLQPAGRDVGPAITAADASIEAASVDSVITMITSKASTGIRERFRKVISARNYKPEDIEAGRAFVRAYVDFLHYVDGLHGASDGAVTDHEGHSERHEH
jgi:hypothetical protein